MDKLRFVAPLAFLVIGLYLFLLAMGAGETVQILPGHEIPDRLSMMLGAVAIFGAIAVGVEAFTHKKKDLPPASARRS